MHYLSFEATQLITACVAALITSLFWRRRIVAQQATLRAAHAERDAALSASTELKKAAALSNAKLDAVLTALVNAQLMLELVAEARQ